MSLYHFFNSEVPKLSLNRLDSARTFVQNEEDTGDGISILDEDDAAVILQELSMNYAVSNSTTSSRPSTVLLSALAKSGKQLLKG